MRASALLLGGIVGGIGAMMTWAMPALFIHGWMGGLVGVQIAVVLGVIAAWIIQNSALHSLHDVLAHLREPERPAPPTGSGELDDLVGELREDLARWNAVREDVEALDRLLNPGGRHAANGAGSAADRDREAGASPIQALIRKYREAVTALIQDVRALAESSERIASGTAEQEEPLSQATFTLESLYQNTRQISKNSESASEATELAKDAVHHGLEQVRGMIEGMERIRSHVENNGRKVQRLGERSVEIVTITETIEGISKRTENLAINSEIAAARAGEHGREFSVVAGEIRKLSERTAAATRDIGELVESIQADTGESVKAFGQEQAEVEHEAKRVRAAGEALDRINEAAERSALLVDGISRSANEQVSATSEVVNLMAEVLRINKRTADDAAQARRYVSTLTARCEELRQLTALDENGARRGGRPKTRLPRVEEESETPRGSGSGSGSNERLKLKRISGS